MNFYMDKSLNIKGITDESEKEFDDDNYLPKAVNKLETVLNEEFNRTKQVNFSLFVYAFDLVLKYHDCKINHILNYKMEKIFFNSFFIIKILSFLKRKIIFFFMHHT